MAEKLWGGRFTKKTDPLVEVFTRSSHYDYKLAACDIRGSHLHVDVLYKSGYLSRAEADKLHKGLEFVARKIKNGRVAEEWLCCEDIHTYIQNALLKKVGVLALKLHTARSRNDQVAFDTKLYAQVALLLLNEELENLCGAFALGAKKYAKLIIPGFTHLQHAQPVRAEDYLNAYAQMLRRDQLRLSNAAKGITLTQGAGALAGTPVEHSHYQVKGELSAAANALDAVSDRDFVIEIIAALSILTTHLSRLAEDLILWSSKEFSFVDIDEAYCTGSSLMPQKKNPDTLELIRGYAGRLYGNLVSVLTMMKGLPLGYNRDMQLDKEPLFESCELVATELRILTGLIKTLKFNASRIAEHLKDESLYVTDLVYYLVDRKVAFKDAHTIIGKLVKYSLDNKLAIKDMPESLLKKFSKKFKKSEIIKYFDPKHSVNLKKSIKRKKVS